MAKKAAVLGVSVVVAIVGVVAYGVLNSPNADDIPLETLGSPVMGNPDAEITIIEFGDYQCHQCYNWFHNTKPALTAEYIDTGKANLVFIDMAFLGRHSPVAAQATHCAGDQDMYWEYHDLLYQLQEPEIDGGWANVDRLKASAFSLDLDVDAFDECLDSGKYKKLVQESVSKARSLGVSGTPTFIIMAADGESQRLVGAQPYSVFQDVIAGLA